MALVFASGCASPRVSDTAGDELLRAGKYTEAAAAYEERLSKAVSDQERQAAMFGLALTQLIMQLRTENAALKNAVRQREEKIRELSEEIDKLKRIDLERARPRR